MDNIINIDNFVDEIEITLQENEATDFDRFIARQQPAFLRSVLGVELYNEFKAGMEEDTPADKWNDLKDGADFTYDSETYHFDGLVKGFTYYCYVIWLQQKSMLVKSSSFINPKQENSNEVNPASSLILIQNKCMDWSMYDLYLFVDANSDDYTSYLYGDPFTKRFNLFGV